MIKVGYMNNVISILVDSVFSDCLSAGRTEESSTPFIDSLIENGVFSPNIYSYGPYTDAATKGLYCGAPSLKHYGYYYGLNSSNNYHFRTFHDNGYETYGFYYPYYLVGSKVRQYIDHTCYTGGFNYPAIWMGKYEYYANRKKDGLLSDDEYTILTKYTDLLFDCWLNFYYKLKHEPESAYIVKNATRNKSDSEIILKKEYEKYLQNKTLYIDGILDNGINHVFSSINDYIYDYAIDLDWINKNVYVRHKKFFKEIDKVEFWRNLKNNRFNLKKCLTNRRYLQNVGICLFSGKYSRYVSRKPEWQLVSSMYKKLETVFDILEKRKTTDKPFYFSLHTEEPHNYVTWFSYDIKNQSIIDEEIEYLKPLLYRCGKKFKGNILYQLSLRYVDLCVKRLVEKLRKLNLLEKTTIVLMADHGTSYSYYPVRESVVNNFYKENYKTPLLVWDGGCRSDYKGEFNGLYSAADVQATICKFVGLQMPSEYCGNALMDLPKGRECVITEYMGPGCPDMISRDVWMSARNEFYCIAYKINIASSFDINSPVEVYDLKNDPYELSNICDRVKVKKNEKLLSLASAIEARFIEIKIETKEFLQDI